MEEEELRPHGALGSQLRACPGGADIISALPDELLLAILARLGCLPTAAQTSLLSRRWRDLWTHLPRVAVAFNDVALGDLEAALARAACLGSHLLLDVRVPAGQDKVVGAHVSSLLHAASRLSPVELVFALRRNPLIPGVAVALPRFHRATSIELDVPSLRLAPPQAGGFPALERLSLSDCRIDLSAMIPCCPRLRALRLIVGPLGAGNFTIHSLSLQELVVDSKNKSTRRIDIEVPMLEQLNLSFHTGKGLSVSIISPKVDKVSWRCSYTRRAAVRLGIWDLQSLILETVESHGHGVQLPRIHVLSLHIRASSLFSRKSISSPDAELSFELEIQKNLVADFRVLELHLTPEGHVFGALVLCLLGMNSIRTATQRLKVLLLRSEVKQACPVNCQCREFNNRRSRNIPLTYLQVVEIIGFQGEDDEFDFLKLIFRCAPMLKRIIVKLSDEVVPSDDGFGTLYKIFKENPSVECHVCFTSD